MIDIIADAFGRCPRRGRCGHQQQSVNVGGFVNIAVALKRLRGLTPAMRCRWAGACGPEGYAAVWQGIISVIDAVEGDNGWCLALVEPDDARLCLLAAWKTSGMRTGCRSRTPQGVLSLPVGYQLASSCGSLH